MWILPSRSRPASMIRFIDAYLATKATDKIYVRLDEDDPCIDAYKNISWPETFIVTIGPRARMPRALNEAFETFPDEPCYGILGDDVVPKTEAWDQELKVAAGAWGISYGRDGQNDRSHATHPLMGGELARAWGCLALGQLTHLYNDTVWMELGKAGGVLVYVESVYMEHLHFSTGKSEFDEIYDRRDELGDYASRDKEVFEAWRERGLPNTVKRIQAIVSK